MAKGFAQHPSINYNETYAPLTRLYTIWTILELATQYNWLVYQFDVKSSFLNGVLKEEVYVQHPQWYEVTTNEQKVYKLKKALYSLK